MGEGHFSALYRQYLEQQGLTANSAAPRLGISHQTSYHYAAGLSLPPRTRVPALALAMGLPLADLSAAVDADRTPPRPTAAPAAGW